MISVGRTAAPTLTLAVVTALALSGCSPAASPAQQMDVAAVESVIESVPGVTDAHVGVYNTGAPGAAAALVSITVDQTGFDALGDVVGGAVDAVAADPGDLTEYQFEVTAPDPADTSEFVIISLGDYQDLFNLPAGSYLGSTLTLTPDELQRASSGS